MQWVRENKPDPQKKKAYRTALIITLSGNILLAVAKGLVSCFSGSIALYADTANSISDGIHSLAMVGGLSIALWIFKSAFEAGKENFAFLTGAGASKEFREEIIKVVKNVEGVETVHHMMSDYVGPKLVVDVHINLPRAKTLDGVHAISDRVIEALEDLPEVDRAYVHVEPYEDFVKADNDVPSQDNA